MAKKGGKTAKGKGPSKPKAKKEAGAGGPAGASKSESLLEELATLPPQERITSVRPFWESLPQAEREGLLTVSLDELREYAARATQRLRKQAAAEAAAAAAEGGGGDAGPAGVVLDLSPSLEELLEEAVRRSADKGTWKVWQWPGAGVDLYDSESFRKYLEKELMGEELRKLLPREGADGEEGKEGSGKEGGGSKEGGSKEGSAKEGKEAKPVEKPAEAALRLRMVELLQRVHAMNRQAQEEEAQHRYRPVGRGGRGGGGGAAGAGAGGAAADPQGAVRDVNVELITLMMTALEKEHEFLYQLVLYPLTTHLAELLPEGSRDSSRTELFFEDLEKLPPEEVARMCEWLTEKLDSFSSKLKPEAKELLEEEEEEPIGDVDLFCLTPDKDALTVHPKWLTHLQERQLGEDGQPRKVKPTEDPHHMGLVLEWVYGTIVSTAEKARDGAKRSLGSRPPHVESAHEQLVTNLRDLAAWDARARTARELLAEMVASRKEAKEVAGKYGVKPYRPPEKKAPGEVAAGEAAPPAGEAGGEAGAAAEPREALPGEPPAAPAAKEGGEDMVPDAAMLSMLRREVLLTRAKLHYLSYQQMMAERMLRSLKAQLRQGEPEFDRLKREVEEVKNHQRGLDGTYRTAAEMERHRAQLADAAIEEQIEVQTAFREQGQRLQRIYDHRRETELAMARREQEMKQLASWKATVMQIITQLEDTLKLSAPLQQLTEDVDIEAQNPDTDAARALVQAVQSVTQQSSQLAKLRLHFHKDIRRQLYGDEDDRAFFDTIKKQLREIEKRMEDGRAALQHVENFVVNVACDDPGAAVGAQLLLPLLQERLDARALEYAARRAEEAQQEVIRMELEMAERERQEREKKAKQKQKAKDKLRSEKEKERAEREAREAAQQQQRLEEERQRQQAEEEERRRRADELEALRKAEEELMEARRQELLADEGSHWRQRMEAELLMQAQLELERSQQATELSDSANEAELPDSFQASGGPREFKRRAQQPAAAQQPGASVRRRGEGEEGYGSGGRSDRDRQQRHPVANGYAHAGANGHGPAAERGPRGERQGRPGRDVGPPRPQQQQEGGPRHDRERPTTQGRPATPASGRSPVTVPRPPQQQQPAAAPPAAVQPASAAPKAPRPASPPVPSGSAAAAAPGPSDFPPLSTAAPVPQQEQQQPSAAAATVAEPADDAGSAAIAQPPAATATPGPSAEGEPAAAAPAAVPSPPPAAAPAAGPAPAPTAADSQKPPSAVPAAAAHAAPAGPPPAVPMPVPVPVPVPVPLPGMAMAPPPMVVPVPLPGAMLPPGAVRPGMPPPAMAGPPHLPHPPTPQPSGEQPQQPGRERGPRDGPPQPELPQGPIPMGLPIPPPFAAPFPPMGPGGPMPPQGPMPIMFFGGPPPPMGPGGAPQMVPPGRGGPRPGPVPFMVPAGMFPPMPVQLMPGHHPAMMGMPVHGGPGMRPHPQQQQQQQQQQQHGGRAGASGGGGGGSTTLRVTAQPFVPSFQRPARRVDVPPASTPATEGGSKGEGKAGAGEQPAVPTPDVSLAPAGSSGSSPRGPLDGQHSLPGQKSLASAASSSSVAGAPSPAIDAASDASSSSGGGAEPQPQHQQQQQPSQQPGFRQPPLPTTTAARRGGQPPVAGAGTSTPSSSSSPPQPSAPSGSSSSSTHQPPPPQQGPLPQPILSSSLAAAPPAQPSGERAAGQVQQRPLPPQQQHEVAAAPPPPPAVVDLERLRLVRGLDNAPGAYNCFLNVVVQCLWHLAPFRQALLALPAAQLEGRGGAPVDVKLMQALWGVFKALDEPASAAAPGGGQRTAVSAAPLREALTGLRGGVAAAAAFELGEMQDAAEVLGEMFDSMYRAQLGAAAVAAGDPTLPRRVRVPAADAPALPPPAVAAAAPRRGAGGSEPVYVSERDPALSGAGVAVGRATPTVWSNGSALAKVKQAPPQQQQPGAEPAEGLVMRIFGQEVQVPLPAGAPPAAAPAAAKLPRGMVEVLQYVQYFRLVPAAGLRGGGGSVPFEELLLRAEAPAAAPAPRARLLRRPQVMALGLVWASPQAPSEAIAATMQALGTELDAGRLFSGPASGPPYRLRCLMCYHRNHYQAFALSEEAGRWLRFDDAQVELVGGWPAVVAAVVAGHLMPSVLFYEAAPAPAHVAQGAA